MILGNAGWGFREMPLCDALAYTKELGLHTLELGIANAPTDITLDVIDDELDAIKALYAKYGLDLVCAATGNDFTCGNSDDVQKVKRVVDICVKLEVKYLRIFAGFSPVAEVVGDRWNIMIDSINACYDYAKNKGVTICVETHGGVNGFEDGIEHFYSTSTEPKALSRLLAEVNAGVKFVYDPANLWAVGEAKPEDFAKVLDGRIGYVHLKDFEALPSGHIKPTYCGVSKMNLKAVIDALNKFDGYVLFEYELPETIKEGTKACVDFVNSIGD